MQRLRNRFRHNASLGRIKRRHKLTKILKRRQRERRIVYFLQEQEE